MDSPLVLALSGAALVTIGGVLRMSIGDRSVATYRGRRRLVWAVFVTLVGFGSVVAAFWVDRTMWLPIRIFGVALWTLLALWAVPWSCRLLRGKQVRP